MKHQLKEGMAAKCANAQEMRSAINAIVAARSCHFVDVLPGDFESYPFLIYLHGPEWFTGVTRWSGNGNTLTVRIVPLHEFILRALGQWIEEPKELTLEVARELLERCASCIESDRERIAECGKPALLATTVLDQLAKYGIKP